MKFDLNQFEKFIAPSGRMTPFATFDANAKIYFSSAAAKQHNIFERNYKFAQLFLNKQERIIAIKLLNEQTEGALQLKLLPQGGAFINAKSFAFKYEMMSGEKLSETYKGKYLLEEAELEGEGDVFFINLNQKK